MHVHVIRKIELTYRSASLLSKVTEYCLSNKKFKNFKVHLTPNAELSVLILNEVNS